MLRFVKSRFAISRFTVYGLILIILLGHAAYLYLYTPVTTTAKLSKTYKGDYSKVFAAIYDQELWGDGFGSGRGSLPANAVEYLQLVQRLFDSETVKTVIDFGCGDWQLMQNIKIPQNKIYIGYDVVPGIVVANNVRFGEENVHFFEVSTLEDFKQRDIHADVLILKDVLQHWPQKDIQYFIGNILPNFKYALITNEFDNNPEFTNQDCSIGAFRPLDLAKAPYNLNNLQVLLDYTYIGKNQKRVYLYTNPNNPQQISLKD